MTNDDALADWMATFARHGGKGEHVMEGINSRLDGLQGAVLNVKLPHLAAWTKARQRVAALRRTSARRRRHRDAAVAPDRDHVYHLYVIRTERRDALENISRMPGSRPSELPKALPFYPAYAYLGHTPEDFPVAHANQSRILSLPIYPEMTDEMMAYVVAQIKGFFA